MQIRVATVTLSSASAYSQSKPIAIKKQPREPDDEFESRVWQERIHHDEGEVYIPASALKNAIVDAARYLGMRVGGKGMATYTKHFEGGVMILDHARLGIKLKDVEGERLFLNADGKKNGGKRVWRTMPNIRKWSTTVDIHVLDETITEDVFEQHLQTAGVFVGIGRWRPRNGGNKGRFKVESIKWSKMNN
jgi:hypothetical protein